MLQLHLQNVYGQVELGKVEGFWRALQLLQQALVMHLNVEQQAYWLLMLNKLISYAMWIIMWLYKIQLETICLHHLEFHDITVLMLKLAFMFFFVN